MRRGVGLLVVMAMIASSCGGDSTVPAVDDSKSPASELPIPLEEAVDPETLAAVEQVIDYLGPDTAFYAVLYALDDGYDADQIIAAITDRSLREDGSIPDAEPARPQVGVVTRSGPSAYGDLTVLAAGESLALGPTIADSAEALKCAALVQAQHLFLRTTGFTDCDPFAPEEATSEEATAMVSLLLALTMAGYSVDQIVGNLLVDPEGTQLKSVFSFFEEPDGFADPFLLCPTIEDRGNPVRPAFRATGRFTDCQPSYDRLGEIESEAQATTTSLGAPPTEDQSEVADDEGDVARYCGTYDTFIDEWITRFDAFLTEGLSEVSDADALEQQAAGVFLDLFREMAQTAPGEIASEVELLTNRGFNNVWSDDGFSEEQLDALLAVDTHTEKVCGFSLVEEGD